MLSIAPPGIHVLINIPNPASSRLVANIVMNFDLHEDASAN